jgi:hypothetical protein
MSLGSNFVAATFCKNVRKKYGWFAALIFSVIAAFAFITENLMCFYLIDL